MVGTAREQNGHWNSENSTMVTLGAEPPFLTESPTATLYTSLETWGGRGPAGAAAPGPPGAVADAEARKVS